jgi:glutamine amidotransferase
MQRVAIIDYGSGNLHSAAKAFERAARESEAYAEILLTADPKVVAAADRIVLPGVGAFADCKRGLEAVPRMRDALEAAVRGKSRPFLGICVGMQLMATRGLEFEVTDGLDWIGGEVRAIQPNDPNLKIPHMGWNTLSVGTAHALLEGIPTGPEGLHAYFVHSFHFVPDERSSIVAETDYGGPVTAFIAKDNVAGTQFHPEKSQTLGLKLIANFLKWRP